MMFIRREAGVVRVFQTGKSATRFLIYEPGRSRGDEDRKAVGVDEAWYGPPAAASMKTV
jgi:hypothetical protein